MRLYRGAMGGVHVCDVCGGAAFVLLWNASDNFLDDCVVADKAVLSFGDCGTFGIVVVELIVVDAVEIVVETAVGAFVLGLAVVAAKEFSVVGMLDGR